MHDGKALWKPLAAKGSGESAPSTGREKKPHGFILGSEGFQDIRQYPKFTQQTLRPSFQCLLQEVTQGFRQVCASRAQLLAPAAKPDDTERAYSHEMSPDLYMCAKAYVCAHTINKQENA